MHNMHWYSAMFLFPLAAINAVLTAGAYSRNLQRKKVSCIHASYTSVPYSMLTSYAPSHFEE